MEKKIFLDNIPIIVVCGPTASGKTGLAIDIAKKYNGEIVSADSMQIYKYMDIGTAKPTLQERSEAPHHLIDFLNPDDEFSVADYTPLAHKTIEDIINRGKLPIIAGGTGLYINSVINDITFGEIDTDYELRAELEERAKTEGIDSLVKELATFDEVSAKKIHPNNTRRIIRAIEFYRTTGMPISKHQEMTKQVKSRYTPLMLMIDHEREKLYERINLRVDIMMNEGLVCEVKRLMDMGYGAALNSMKGIGYKEIMGALEGKYSIDEAVEMVKLGSRHYAKRQLTWFRRDERINYLNAQNDVFCEAHKLIDNFLCEKGAAN